MENKELIKNLRSKNEHLILESLKYISSQGNRDVLGEVLSLLKATNNDNIRLEIINILDNLKDQSCVSLITETIKNKDFENELQILVSACWKNGLNYQDYALVFTNVFINSDFMLAFDAFTVIDNFEEMDESLAKKCINKLKTSVEEIKEDKKSIYLELIKRIEELKNPAE